MTDISVAQRAKARGIRSVPAVVIEANSPAAARMDVNEATLRAAGLAPV